MEDYGYGPWHVALLQDAKQTTTKVVTHTHISLLLDSLFEVSKSKERWVPLLEVGPFSKLQDALDFADKWTMGSRGLESRLRFGRELSLTMPLDLSIQSVSVETYSRNRQWDRKETTHISWKCPPSVKQIQAIERVRSK